MKQPIKWTGSKRPFVNTIAEKVPRPPAGYGRYVEPFVGGGSLFLHLLEFESNLFGGNFHINDINPDLVGLWHHIKSEPEYLCDEYRRMWCEINAMKDVEQRKAYFYGVRARFNRSGRDPAAFLFLLRTSFNGLVRYNAAGEYNTSYHFSRPGVKPDDLEKSIKKYGWLMQDRDVKVTNLSYSDILYRADDFVFMDPPYIKSLKTTYTAKFDHERFKRYVMNVRGSLFITLDERLDGFDQHVLSSKSSFKKLKETADTESTEYLNIKITNK